MIDEDGVAIHLPGRAGGDPIGISKHAHYFLMTVLALSERKIALLSDLLILAVHRFQSRYLQFDLGDREDSPYIWLKRRASSRAISILA